jgi:hypothetical protein
MSTYRERVESNEPLPPTRPAWSGRCQLLADKVSGNQVGIWLLVPEHLRLGTWDLLVRWSGQSPQRVEPRLGLHLVNESAFCLCSYRYRRTLSKKDSSPTACPLFPPTMPSILC